jgi:hypothetical protein
MTIFASHPPLNIRSPLPISSEKSVETKVRTLQRRWVFNSALIHTFGYLINCGALRFIASITVWFAYTFPDQLKHSLEYIKYFMRLVSIGTHIKSLDRLHFIYKGKLIFIVWKKFIFKSFHINNGV